MLCEMCGKDVEATSAVRVEGSVLQLCPSCSRFGQPLNPPAAPVESVDAPWRPAPVSAPRPSQRPRSTEERDLFQDLPEMELAPDWGQRIRHAREKLAWTPEELGKRLNEKKSVILKLESGSFRPLDETIRRIERLLHIRLRSEAAPSAAGGERA